MYNHQAIEKKWQKFWEDNKLNQAEDKTKKPKKYILDMFPYLSGKGLHVGHVESYTATDINSRYYRLNGYNVLHPQGWDAFGLPAENYAITTGIHPRETSQEAIANFKKQIQILGLSYDWSREINTSSPEYYKWTQWLFLQLYKKGLAYKKQAPVNWCQSCQTVLANEQVVNGQCERCESQVIQKDLEQWFFKITDYAEELLDEINKMDWPEGLKQAQRNWIGKSAGALLNFELRISNFEANPKSNPRLDRGQNPKSFIEVFTTRPDTLFGATYLVLAPEHPIIQDLRPITNNWNEVEKYINKAKTKNKLERTDLAKEKIGVELKGVKAINPGSKEEMPIWVADYVLMDYGTGAIMAVPAHDERDFEFAKKYNLPVKQVIIPATKVYGVPKNISNVRIEKVLKDFKYKGYYNYFFNFETYEFLCFYQEKNGVILIDDEFFNALKIEKPKSFSSPYTQYFQNSECYEKEGFLQGSEKFNNLFSTEAKDKITEFVGGKKQTQFKIRDWLISRQRFWGAPIPIIYCDKCGVVPVPENDLPVLLPDDVDFKPTGESPLTRSKKFHEVKCPKCDAPARRESDTMDSFVCSSWYFLRYTDPHNNKEFADKKKLKYWLPVDLYIGGMEHAVGHLIYSRFMTKALADLGYLSFREPFLRIKNQGIILGEDSRKMSKRWGNVVNPDNVVKEYGADTLRMYEMFMGPLEDMKPWDSRGIVGVKRFLDKIYNLVSTKYQIPSTKQNSKSDPRLDLGRNPKQISNPNVLNSKPDIEKLLHKTIKKVTEDIENLRFNTAISAMMIFINQFSIFIPDSIRDQFSIKEFEKFLIILSPFAPHLAEELWEKLGHNESIFKEKWPKYDKKLIIDEEVNIAVQVNGKLRDTILVEKGINEKNLRSKIKDLPKIEKYIEGKEIKKFIYIKDKLVNIVL